MTTTRATSALPRRHPVAASRPPLQSIITEPPSQRGDSSTSASLKDVYSPATAGSPMQQDGRDGRLTWRDALSFLDSVKSQFAEQPEVYDEFLDVMKDHHLELVDFLGLMKRVSELFHCYPALIQAFSAFFPAGYRMEARGGDVGPNAVVITTPTGTTVYNPTTRRISTQMALTGKIASQSRRGRRFRS